jgi:hypothetical protein
MPAVLRVQGAYYLVTGPPAIAFPRAFQVITGPKRDMWLAKTVGALITVIGGVLFASAKSSEPSKEMTVLATGSALVLGASDLIYGGAGRNTRVYYLDAVAQAALLAAIACGDFSMPEEGLEPPTRGL